MDDNDRESADDALEEVRREEDGMFHPDRDEEHLAEDGRPPAALADDVPANAPLDHPATDTDVDEDEAYDEGLGEAADDDDRIIGPDSNARPLEPES